MHLCFTEAWTYLELATELDSEYHLYGTCFEDMEDTRLRSHWVKLWRWSLICNWDPKILEMPGPWEIHNEQRIWSGSSLRSCLCRRWQSRGSKATWVCGAQLTPLQDVGYRAVGFGVLVWYLFVLFQSFLSEMETFILCHYYVRKQKCGFVL